MLAFVLVTLAATVPAAGSFFDITYRIDSADQPIGGDPADWVDTNNAFAITTPGLGGSAGLYRATGNTGAAVIRVNDHPDAPIGKFNFIVEIESADRPGADWLYGLYTSNDASAGAGSLGAMIDESTGTMKLGWMMPDSFFDVFLESPIPGFDPNRRAHKYLGMAMEDVNQNGLRDAGDVLYVGYGSDPKLVDPVGLVEWEYLVVTSDEPKFADVFVYYAGLYAKQLTGVPGQSAPGFDNFTLAIPEPATLALVALGGLAMLRRRR
jgi:hypothetical protein